MLSAAQLQGGLIPVLLFHRRAVVYPAHPRNGAGRQKHPAYFQRRIYIQLDSEAVVQQQGFCVLLVDHPAAQGGLGVQILQLVRADFPAQQLAQLLIAGVSIHQLLHRLRKNAAQAHIGLNDGLL